MSEIVEKFQRALKEWDKRYPNHSGDLSGLSALLTDESVGDLRALLGEIEQLRAQAGALASSLEVLLKANGCNCDCSACEQGRGALTPDLSALADEWRKGQEAIAALESIAPPGSEFHGDVKRCAEWIRGELQWRGERVKTLVQARNTAEQAKDVAEARVAELEQRFRHYHAAKYELDESTNRNYLTSQCSKCGMDLRDPIHIHEKALGQEQHKERG